MAQYVRTATQVQHSFDEGANVSEADVDMSDMGAIMAALKIGTTMTKLPSKAKGKPEQKTFQLNLDEFKISWFRGAGSKEEGSSKSLLNKPTSTVIYYHLFKIARFAALI